MARRPDRVADAADRERPLGWRRSRWLDVVQVVVVAMVAVQAYALVHEAGRAFSAWLVGVRVVGFDAWALGRPSIRLAGDLSGTRGAWISVGGVLWPWLLTLLAAAVWRPRGPLLRLTALLLAVVVVGSTVPWIVAPLTDRWAGGDEVAQFLLRSGAPPWWVATAAAMAAALLVSFVARAVGGLRGGWAAVRAVDGVGRRPIAWALVLGAAAVVLLATEAGGRWGGAAATVLPPPGFAIAADVGLRSGIGDDQLLGDEALVPHVLEVWVAVEGADQGPITVEVVDPAGSRIGVLRLPVDVPVGRANARTAPIRLPAGPWAVVASAPRGEGRLVVAWRSRGD